MPSFIGVRRYARLQVEGGRLPACQAERRLGTQTRASITPGSEDVFGSAGLDDSVATVHIVDVNDSGKQRLRAAQCNSHWHIVYAATHREEQQ